MIIWSRLGFLVAVITASCCGVLNWMLDAQFGKGYYSSHLWATGVALIVGGVLSSVLGFAIRPGEGRVVIDAQTRKRIRLRDPDHSFFFVPMHWAGLVIAGIGLILGVKGLLEGPRAAGRAPAAIAKAAPPNEVAAPALDDVVPLPAPFAGVRDALPAMPAEPVVPVSPFVPTSPFAAKSPFVPGARVAAAEPVETEEPVATEEPAATEEPVTTEETVASTEPEVEAEPTEPAEPVVPKVTAVPPPAVPPRGNRRRGGRGRISPPPGMQPGQAPLAQSGQAPRVGRNQQAIPNGTRAIKPGEKLEVGDRVIANWGPTWDVGKVEAVLTGRRAHISFPRLSRGFDETLGYDKIRIALPRDEIDPELLVTVKFDFGIDGFDDDVDQLLAETELRKAEGYVRDSLKVDHEARQVTIEVLRGSWAEQVPSLAFGDASMNVGRKLKE